MSETPCGFLFLKKIWIKPPGESPSFKRMLRQCSHFSRKPKLLRLETSWKTCLRYIFIFSHALCLPCSAEPIQNDFLALHLSFVQADHQTHKKTQAHNGMQARFGIQFFSHLPTKVIFFTNMYVIYRPTLSLESFIFYYLCVQATEYTGTKPPHSTAYLCSPFPLTQRPLCAAALVHAD